MTVTLWNGAGEKVSSFEAENNRVWILINKTRKNKDLNVIQTKDVLFRMLMVEIKKGVDIEAMCLISKDDKFLLESVSWREIAIRAIRDG